ncbi:MAG: hypothetical protein ACFCVK_06220 [Acidimicrobiales bacterium]
MTDSAVTPFPARGTDRRTLLLVAIAAVVAAVTIGTWLVGRALDAPIVAFAGLMVGATTFVPLPADTFVLAAAPHEPALLIGVVGGVINAVMILIERAWILVLVEHPWFDRFRRFFETNRFVAWTERNMFVSLLVGAATFIPFEPFRLIATLTRYSMSKYVLATLIGRGGRYLALAALGTALLEVGWLDQAIGVTLVLFLLGLCRSALKLHRGSRR